jgi:hypothetical protein
LASQEHQDGTEGGDHSGHSIPSVETLCQRTNARVCTRAWVDTMACRAVAWAKAEPPCEDFTKGAEESLVRHYPKMVEG